MAESEKVHETSLYLFSSFDGETDELVVSVFADDNDDPVDRCRVSANDYEGEDLYKAWRNGIV